MLPSTVYGEKLGMQKWRDYLFLRYGITSSHLPDHCDGYGVAFDICNTLDCKNGGLITAHHNDLCDRVSDLESKYFTPTHVLGDPKIYIGRAVRGGKDKLKGSP